jgi:hypothetical protein
MDVDTVLIEVGDDDPQLSDIPIPALFLLTP